ncbi:SRPBCC family protein [Leptospira sp. GIMC2001]|uniref:SRPBCC family protein n=1 Tax=Leptospira sp. GIMC2001 TaxID=1513297 RepID=UPI002349AF08|nr:SRPBCC domain-containing protein [Leptospira sp. GIMC2001]WCL47769.1 SRPBCC domain-containing protein [Leptospira sp. GIMC2001]
MREIKKDYIFNQPLEVVWDSLTIYEILIHWLADEVRGRPKLGQEFSWSWKLGDEGEFTTKGIYEAIEPNKLLILRWKDHPAGDIFLRLDVTEVSSDKTKLTITNGGFPDSSHFDLWLEGAEAAWDDQTQRLKAFLDKNPNPRTLIK